MFVDMSVNTNIEGTVWDGLKGDYLTERAYLRGYISDFDASELTLYTSSNVINVSARDALLTDYIEFEVQTTIIPTTSITWKAYNGGSEISGVLIDLVTPTEGKKRLDCSALPYLTIKSLTVEATIAYGGKTYRDVQAVAIAKSTLITAVNFGGVKLVPATTPDGESLATGDYFLWADDSTATYTKGQIYVYNVSSWREATEDAGDGDLVMTLFDSFANLDNDVDSSVIGNAVIKKLVAIDAFIQNLQAENLKAGTGDGTTGFRFRAQSHEDMAVGADPVFDIWMDNEKLFEVVASGTDKGDILIGNYATGKGVWYDNSTGEFKAKFSQIRNVLPYDFSDSLDTYTPLVVDFFIPTSTVNIISIKVNLKSSNYRAYSQSLAFQSDSGMFGLSTEATTPSISFSTRAGTTGSVYDHYHTYTKITGIYGFYGSGAHSHSLSTNSYSSTGSTSAGGDYHSHTYVEVTGITGNGSHTHSLTSSTDNTSSTGGHSHSYEMMDDISVGSHTHQFSISHSHDIVFGITEGTLPTGVNMYIDNGSGYGSAIYLGSTTILASDLDIAAYILGTGWKTLKFTSATMGRITGHVIAEVDITV